MLKLSHNLLEIIKTEKPQKLKIIRTRCNIYQIKRYLLFLWYRIKTTKNIYLNNNAIKEINIIGEINYEQIYFLNLGYCNIVGIDALKNISVKNIKYLNLSNNLIKNIRPFENIHFPKIRKLSIVHNLIDNDLQKNKDIINNFLSNIINQVYISLNLL